MEMSLSIKCRPFIAVLIVVFLISTNSTHATVLLDNSKADQEWGVGVYDDGRYVYFFKGYEELGNPPTLSSTTNVWVTPATTTVARIKRLGATTCGEPQYRPSGGFALFGPTYNIYPTNTYYNAQVGDDYCDFYFTGEGIPPGTPLSVAFLGAERGAVVAGSSANEGSSTNGSYGDVVSGGFAFQLCDIDGCSGGFSTTTATTTPPVATTTGASSVLFLPGIEGSRLYEQVNGEEKRRWEAELPWSQDDIRALNLDVNGNSLNAIYTKDGEAVATTDIPRTRIDIYRTYFEQLESLKNGEVIENYKIFPYDWRKSPIDVAEGANDYSDGVRYLSTEVEKLASASKSGKVTIVGHSNGGLVAKALMIKMEREGTAGLVDKVVLVDSPQLGTPDSLIPTLHGDFGALTSRAGLYVSKENMRNLAHNMPDAYALLPSAEYFNTVSDQVIDLMNAPELRTVSGISSSAVSTQTDFVKFMTGIGGKTKPASSNTEYPDNLSQTLLSGATALHGELDSWTPTEGVRVIEVIGWGLDTPKGVQYFEQEKSYCPGFGAICIKRTELTHAPLYTKDGDGTVVTASAVTNPASERYFIDLPTANSVFSKNWKHADITESKPFQDLFPLLIATSSPEALPEHVTTQKPEVATSNESLRVRVLSPVSLSAYDSRGRHTGIVLNPQGELLAKEEQIPNSYYQEYGEGKYIGLPADETVTVDLKGLDTGTFTFEMSSISEEGNTTVTYKNVPVTASTTAQIVINEEDIKQASLVLDVNGDGQTDVTIASSTQSETPLMYVRLIRLTVETMDMGTSTKRQLLAKFGNMERLLRKESTWDDADDDNDKLDVKKGERIEARVLRKLDKIDRWVQRQLTKPQKLGKKNTAERITITQAEAILNMTTYLRALIK
jgi:pimeloyl-ACP methyl ester carboxylesterase